VADDEAGIGGHGLGSQSFEYAVDMRLLRPTAGSGALRGRVADAMAVGVRRGERKRLGE